MSGAWGHGLPGDAGTEKRVFLLVDAQAPFDVLDRDILDRPSTPALRWAFIKGPSASHPGPARPAPHVGAATHAPITELGPKRGQTPRLSCGRSGPDVRALRPEDHGPASDYEFIKFFVHWRRRLCGHSREFPSLGLGPLVLRRLAGALRPSRRPSGEGRRGLLT
ncbi:hypothetical protein J1605_004534, partial [Eschrichtius robustus]